jgi:hypothetical protein
LTNTVNTVLGRPYTILPSISVFVSESGRIIPFDSASLLFVEQEEVINIVIKNMDRLMIAFI